MRAEIEKFGHLHITGFIDSFWTGNFGAYPVITPNDVSAADRTCAVMVIASQHFQEIAQRLAPLGFSDIRDVGSYILKHVDLILAAQKLEDLPLAEVTRRKEGRAAVRTRQAIAYAIWLSLLETMIPQPYLSV
ncbi:hypothetical protein [Azospirillum argentinense]|uniref:hypothetical protein n=1 Tax=Azospirillum argentinense TaxID=2970906 RepID=UPI0011AF2855|nr:hypothetical protein [Azospirillum argentinense]